MPTIVAPSACGGPACGPGGCVGGAATAAGAAAGGSAAPKPSIVFLKSGKFGAAGGAGACTGEGAAEVGLTSKAGAAGESVVAGGAAGEGVGAGVATCMIVRVPRVGATVTAPHSPQNWACSGSKWPQWVQERVFIDPVPVKVAV
jgi:hypothetical protein